jgi:ribonucleoside-diphosphate reductase alpha chain
VVNDTAVAVNQGGKRKGAVCAYLETWHMDIEEFIELRKNTGDDRRRTHDMNTANWIPDLFMKRVFDDGKWTLFSPSEVPDLHDLTGKAFEERYEYYEALTEYRQGQAVQDHPGQRPVAQDAVHAVRNRPPMADLQRPVQPAQPAAARGRGPQLEPVHRDHLEHQQGRNRRLQPGLDQPAEPHRRRQAGHRQAATHREHRRAHARQRDRHQLLLGAAGANSNFKHRPVGLGIMGFQDALYLQHIPYGSDAAVEFADKSMEAVSYYAIQASCDLADERGAYETFRVRCGPRHPAAGFATDPDRAARPEVHRR